MSDNLILSIVWAKLSKKAGSDEKSRILLCRNSHLVIWSFFFSFPSSFLRSVALWNYSDKRGTLRMACSILRSSALINCCLRSLYVRWSLILNSWTIGFTTFSCILRSWSWVSLSLSLRFIIFWCRAEFFFSASSLSLATSALTLIYS